MSRLSGAYCLVVSQQNVEIMRAQTDHFLARGEPLWSVFAEDIEVHDHDIMDASEYRGHEGVGRWLEDWSAAWSEFTMEPREYLDMGDSVVFIFLMRGTGRSSGVAIEREDAMVIEMRDGLATRVDYFNSRAQALEFAGASN
jgi:ketosteroid isomerase-like protein